MYTCIDRYRYLCICNRTQVPRLRKCLQPYLLRREKEEVEKLLPAKKEIIVEVEMSQLQRTTYKSILSRNFAWLTAAGADGRAVVPALNNVEMQLRKCWCVCIYMCVYIHIDIYTHTLYTCKYIYTHTGARAQ